MGEPIDFLVLGAGIAGTAVAYHLAGRSLGSIAVADPRTTAAGATGRAAGVVTEQLWDRWDVDVTRESHREYVELCRPAHPEAYRQNGFVRLTRDATAVPVVEAAVQRLRGWGVEVALISPSELTDLVPDGVFADVAAAMYGSQDACVTPSAVAECYVRESQRRGVRFWLGAAVEPLGYRGDRWEFRIGTTEVRARSVIVAAGAWSKSLLHRLGHPLPLTPYRTQAALFVPGVLRDSFPTVHDIDTDVYVRPEVNGRILAGDGTEHTEADPERFASQGDQEFLAHLASAFDRRFPGWSEAELVSAWAGVCTSTHDRHPMVGAIAGADGLYVLTGFNGFGVMRAGGVAGRLAGVIAGEREARDTLGPAWAGRVTGPIPSFPPRPGFTLEAGESPRF